MKAAALMSEMCGRDGMVRTDESNGAKLTEREVSSVGDVGASGATEAVQATEMVGDSCKNGRKDILLETQSIDRLYRVSQLCPNTTEHKESSRVT